MKVRRIRVVAVLLALVLLCLTAGLNLFGPGSKRGSGQKMSDAADLNGKRMGGIRGAQIGDENAEVFFETLLGVSLSGYRSAETIDELLYDLDCGRVDAVWCPDVCAEYLLKTKQGENLSRLTAPRDTAGSGEDGGRVDFALTLRTDEEELCKELDAAIGVMRADGTMEKLNVAYISADTPMEVKPLKAKHGQKKFAVGVTGTLPPLDLFDSHGNPAGFSVAFFNELEERTGYHFDMVKIRPEESFTALECGKVDILLDFGTSKKTSKGQKDYLTTRGYYTMREYAYLVLK